jgi:hypothetical protein
MISAEGVIRRIETSFGGGANHYLTDTQTRAAERAVAKSLEGPRLDTTINLMTVPAAFERAAREVVRAKAPAMEGRGVLLFAVNPTELAAAVASAKVIRALNLELPIECWITTTCSSRAAAALRSLQVRICEARYALPDASLPFTRPELRLHALAQTQLRQVIVLEPGIRLRVAPQKLFGERAFRDAGVLFTAAAAFHARPGVWKLCGLKSPRLTAGTACIILDRARCWSALSLWQWVVEHAYFFTGYVDGDGGAAQLAFAKLGQAAPLSLSRRVFLNAQNGLPPHQPNGRAAQLAR